MEKKNGLFLISTLSTLLISSVVLASPIVNAGTKSEDISSNVVTARSQYDQQKDVSPRISGNTGWGTTFTNWGNSGDLTFSTTATSLLSGGIGSRFKNEFQIDDSIAEQLFSVPDWKSYITGTITRPVGLIGNHTTDIRDGLNKNADDNDSISYDSTSHKLIYQTPTYLLDLGVNQKIEWNITLNMEAFHKAYPEKLVKRKMQYEFVSQTYNDDLNISLFDEGSSTYIYAIDDDHWIGAEVDPTSINLDDNYNASGVGVQKTGDEYTEYTVSLMLNNKIIATNIPMNSSYKWSYDCSKYGLKSGDTLEARVEGHLANGGRNYSSWTSTAVGAAISYDNWKVNNPILSQPFEGATSVQVDLPNQNVQLNRTYKCIVNIDGKEVATEEYEGHQIELGIPFKDLELEQGQKVSVQIVGHQNGKNDKVSQVDTKEVMANEDFPYNSWVVKAPTAIEEVMSGDSTIDIVTADQDPHNGRTYTLKTYVNGTLINSRDISREKTSYSVVYTDQDGNIKSLNAGDVIKTVITGHQRDEKDKTSSETSIVVKESKQSINGEDVTAYVGDALPEDDAFKASATDKEGQSEKVSIDKTKVDMTKAGDYDVVITAADGQTKTVKVHVKEHEKVLTTNCFERSYWQNYGMVYEGRLKNQDWDMSNTENLKETINIIDANGVTVNQVNAVPTNWYDEKVYDGFQFILDNNLLASLEEGTYSYQIQVTYKGETYDAVPITNEFNTSGFSLYSSLYHDDYLDLEPTVVKGDIVTPILEGNMPEIKIEKQTSTATIKELNVYFNDQMQYVIDGYVESDSAEYTKELIVTDQGGNIVYSKENLPNVSTNWENPVDVELSTTYQAVIPTEFTTTTQGLKVGQYIYTINVKDANGNIISSQEVK